MSLLCFSLVGSVRGWGCRDVCREFVCASLSVCV